VQIRRWFSDVGTSANKEVALVKALLDLIDSDTSIADLQHFFIEPAGLKVTKIDMRHLHNSTLQLFLLGVWHFALVNKQDNRMGRTTIDKWCPADYRNAREYKGEMGSRITRDILVSCSVNEPVEYENSGDAHTVANMGSDNKEQDGQPIKESTTDSDDSTFSWFIDNRAVFTQYGNNNVMVSTVSSLTINNN
jgi:hypothetical protein